MKCKNKNCQNEILNPISSTQQVCSMGCAIQYTEQQRKKKDERQAKQNRKELRKAKEKLKTRGDYTREA